MARIDVISEQRSRSALKALPSHAKVAAAYLFGSQVEGTADKCSDIDLAIFLENAESWDIKDRAHATSIVQKEAGDDFDLHFLPAEALRRTEPASFAAYILAHGVRIQWK